MKTRFKSFIAYTLSLCLILGQLSTAQAAMVDTPSLLSQETQTLQLDALKQQLAQTEVRAQLEGLGVDPQYIEQRLANLTPEELQQLNEQMETLPAGGILGVLLVIFIVFIITDALGATDVFTFVKPIR